MPGDHKDYSGTPLWRKLGMTDGARVWIGGEPEDLRGELVAIRPLPPGVSFLSRPGRDMDVALLFVTKGTELARRFPGLAGRIARAGRLWVAWPKKSSGLSTDLTFDAVQEIGLATGLVDNKSASITSDFQGVQFVIRSKDRR
jgi:hypothetical protein